MLMPQLDPKILGKITDLKSISTIVMNVLKINTPQRIFADWKLDGIQSE